MHVLSDLGVWSAYFTIPCILGYFVLRRRDIPFRSIFWLFGAFILACGTTHLMEAIIFWWPGYRLAGAIKLLTAAISWGTVVALIPTIPKALALRTPVELEREIAARKQAEVALQHANQLLEMRVDERTAQLEQVNASLRESQQRERERAERLQEADRRKDEFLATLAHELRNPLAPIRNSIELLRRADANSDVIGKACHVMERQVVQLVRLVDDLLDISRITSGKIKLRMERVELAAILRSAIEDSRSHIETHSHELTVELPNHPVYLYADSVRLCQIFTNLLNNSAKYTNNGGHIWLNAQQLDGESIVTIRDNGIGIAVEHLPRLFEIFSQAEPALERSQGGLGIGLALVRGLVELHGGTIEARSDGLNTGSEFIVRLPSNDTPGEWERKATEGERNLPGSPRPMRILVVDDNRDAADSLGQMLRIAGHETATAYDGMEAIEVATTFRPEVVVLDIGLPKMNGFEVARRIREQPWGKDLALLALTGWGQIEDKRRALESGFDHHLTKPVDPIAFDQLLVGLAAD